MTVDRRGTARALGRVMLLYLLIAFVLCSLAAIADVRRSAIPNALTYPVIGLAPLLHVARTLDAGARPSLALLQGGYSLIGILSCAALPYVMWRKRALGGGDLKLFAALGALLLPRLSFQVELYVFAIGALVVCGQFAYQGRLFAVARDALRALLPAPRRAATGSRKPPTLGANWFRLGPCFAFAVLCHLLMSWKGF